MKTLLCRYHGVLNATNKLKPNKTLNLNKLPFQQLKMVELSGMLGFEFELVW